MAVFWSVVTHISLSLYYIRFICKYFYSLCLQIRFHFVLNYTKNFHKLLINNHLIEDEVPNSNTQLNTYTLMRSTFLLFLCFSLWNTYFTFWLLHFYYVLTSDAGVLLQLKYSIVLNKWFAHTHTHKIATPLIPKRNLQI